MFIYLIHEKYVSFNLWLFIYCFILVLEKRAGILKPQGSLEKARCEKALSRSRRIDVVSPEPSKLSNDIIVDNSDIQVSEVNIWLFLIKSFFIQ